MSDTSAMAVPVSIVNNLPTMVSSKLAQMTPEEQLHFLEEYHRQTKSIGMGYLAMFTGGWHYGYMNKWGMQFLYWFTLGGCLIWILMDLIRMSSLIKDYNKDVAIKVMRDFRAVA